MGRPATQHDPRRRALVAAAEEVFVVKGYRATTIGDLLAVTGLSKGGFYHYFASKEDVLRASLDGLLDEAESVLRAAGALPGTPTDRLRAVFRGMRELRSRRGEFPRTLAVVLGDETPAAAFHRELIQRLGPPLADILAGFPVAEPRCTAELILDLLTAVTRSPNRAAYLTDPDARVRLTTSLRELIARTLGLDPADPALLDFGW
jgi:AcrR family transcriptional regulator